MPFCVELVDSEGRHYDDVPKHRTSWKDSAGPENETTRTYAAFFNADAWKFHAMDGEDDALAAVQRMIAENGLLFEDEEDEFEDVPAMLLAWATQHPDGRWFNG